MQHTPPPQKAQKPVVVPQQQQQQQTVVSSPLRRPIPSDAGKGEIVLAEAEAPVAVRKAGEKLLRTPPQVTKVIQPLRPHEMDGDDGGSEGQQGGSRSPYSAPVPVLASLAAQVMEKVEAQQGKGDNALLKEEDLEFLAERSALKEQVELQERVAAQDKDLKQHQQKVELLEFQLAKIDGDEIQEQDHVQALVGDLAALGIHLTDVAQLNQPEVVKSFSTTLKVRERKLAEQLTQTEKLLETKTREVIDRKAATQARAREAERRQAELTASIQEETSKQEQLQTDFARQDAALGALLAETEQKLPSLPLVELQGERERLARLLAESERAEREMVLEQASAVRRAEAMGREMQAKEVARAGILQENEEEVARERADREELAARERAATVRVAQEVRAHSVATPGRPVAPKAIEEVPVFSQPLTDEQRERVEGMLRRVEMYLARAKALQSSRKMLYSLALKAGAK